MAFGSAFGVVDAYEVEADLRREIVRLRAALTKIRYLEAADADTWIWQAQEEARKALADT